ncbi:MAG: methyltransferase family protein [Hyphomicrobiaceae bacterium]
MAAVVFTIGVLVAAVLLGLLGLTVLSVSFRIWPTPGPKTWQSYVFWPLFRSLNVLCFATAIAHLPGGEMGVPIWVRAIAFLLLAASLALFIYSFRRLGRDNSYGAKDGLVTGGIYRWSRNPQNAMLVVVYGCLAVATDNARTYILCAAMMAVYTLMVVAEEPWLEAVYGQAYRRYCSRVPRFFNWRRLIMLGRSLYRRPRDQGRRGSA